jgi:hypothetical protein
MPGKGTGERYQERYQYGQDQTFEGSGGGPRANADLDEQYPPRAAPRSASNHRWSYCAVLRVTDNAKTEPTPAPYQPLKVVHDFGMSLCIGETFLKL